MCARFTVLNETPIASAIAGCVIPLSRSSTIWMRSRCAAGIFHRSAVFNCRICFLVHLTIRPPESDSQSESYRVPSCETEKRQKSPDSNSYGSGIIQLRIAMWTGGARDTRPEPDFRPCAELRGCSPQPIAWDGLFDHLAVGHLFLGRRYGAVDRRRAGAQRRTDRGAVARPAAV